MTSTANRRKRVQYKYTPELKQEAKLLKNKLSCERSEKLKQRTLSNKLTEGADFVKRCVCGKLFDERVFGKIPGKRAWCTKCPMRPAGRIRTQTRWSKTKNDYVTKTYVCKR